jgi:hypothetical protein
VRKTVMAGIGVALAVGGVAYADNTGTGENL